MNYHSDPIIQAHRNPSLDDFRILGVWFWFNIDTEEMFIKTGKGWGRIPFEITARWVPNE